MKKHVKQKEYTNPANMIRKNIFITPEQDRAIKLVKRKRYKTESETIRAALTMYLQKIGAMA